MNENYKKVILAFLIIFCVLLIIGMYYNYFIKPEDECFTQYQLNKMLEYNRAIGNCVYIPSENNYICKDMERYKRF